MVRGTASHRAPRPYCGWPGTPPSTPWKPPSRWWSDSRILMAAVGGGQMSEPREGYPERPRDALAWAAKQSPEARLRVKRLASGKLDPANPSLRHHAGLLLHQIGSDQAALPVQIAYDCDGGLRVRRGAAVHDHFLHQRKQRRENVA